MGNPLAETCLFDMLLVQRKGLSADRTHKNHQAQWKVYPAPHRLQSTLVTPRREFSRLCQ